MDLNSLLTTLGWTLLHVSWVGALIGTAAFAVNQLVRKSPRVRYAISLIALLALCASLPATFLTLRRNQDGQELIAEPVADVQPNALALPGRIETIVASGGRQSSGDATTNVASATRAELPVEHSRPQPESNTTSFTPTTFEAAVGEHVSDTDLQPSPSRVENSTWVLWVGIGYCLGVLGMIFRLGFSVIGSHRLRRCCATVEQRVESLFHIQGERIAMRGLPALRVCQRIAVPAVIGVLRPMILIPASMISGLTDEELGGILLHELAHIRRYDHVVVVMQRLVETILFFHPTTWYLSRVLDVEREHCCDDLVVSSGISRVAYAELLLKVAETVVPTRFVTTVAIDGGRPSRLRLRLARVLDGQPPRTRFSTAGSLLLVLSFAVAATAATLVVPNDPVETAESSPEEQSESTVTLIEQVQSATDQPIKRFVSESLGQVVPVSHEETTLAAAVKTLAREINVTVEVTRAAQEKLTATRIDETSETSAVARVLLQKMLAENGLLYETLPDRIVIREAKLRGTVTDEGGNPLSDVKVCVSLHEPRSALRGSSSSGFLSFAQPAPLVEGVATSDAQGRFELTGSPGPGFRYLIWFYSKDRGLWVEPLHTDAKDGTADLRFDRYDATVRFGKTKPRKHMFWEGTIAGELGIGMVVGLFSNRGRLDDNVQVFPTRIYFRPELTRAGLLERYLERFNSDGDSHSEMFAQRQTDEELFEWAGKSLGVFEVAGIPEPIQELMAATTDGEGSAGFHSRFPFESLGVETPGLVREGIAAHDRSVTIDRGVTLTGKVTDFDKLPEANRATAKFTISGQRDSSATKAVIPIADDGTFSAKVGRGRFNRVEANFCDDTKFVLSGPRSLTLSGNKRISMKIEPRAEVRGTVLLPDGKPVVGAEVSVSGFNMTGTSYLSNAHSKVRTDEEGRFVAYTARAKIGVTLLSLPPELRGVYSLSDAEGLSGAVRNRKAPPKDGVYQHPPIRLKKLREITGTVVDMEGQPIPNAWVGTSLLMNQLTQTDTNGSFKLRRSEAWLNGFRNRMKVSRSKFYVTTPNQVRMVAKLESKDPYVLQVAQDEPVEAPSFSARQVLAAGIEPVEFKNVTVKSVLQELTMFSFELDEEACIRSGMPLATVRVTKSLAGMSTQRALKETLEPLGLTWQQSGPGLTAQERDGRFYRRVSFVVAPSEEIERRSKPVPRIVTALKTIVTFDDTRPLAEVLDAISKQIDIPIRMSDADRALAEKAKVKRDPLYGKGITARSALDQVVENLGEEGQPIFFFEAEEDRITVAQNQLQGTVVDAAGKPVPNAIVMTQIHFPMGRAKLSISGFEHSKEEKPPAKTDERGRFRIKGRRPSLVVPLLWVYSADAGLAAEPIYTKSDIAGHSLRFDGPDKTIRLVAGTCEVQMKPSEDQNLRELEGMPIRPSGAIFETELFRQAISTVSYAKPTAEVPVHIPSRLQYLLETKIDRSGAATIPCGLDVHTFRVKTPRDVWHDVVAQVMDGKPIQVPLTPDRELVGTIEDYATLPEGALDDLFAYSEANGRASQITLRPDKNGNFSTHIGSGKMNVWGHFKDNKVPLLIVGDLTTNIGNNRPARIKLKVQKAATVRGRVTLEDGTPIAAADVWVQTREMYPQRAIGFTVGSSGKTDENGWYELHVRPTQISRVSCQSLPEDLALKHSPGDVVVADTKRKVYKLTPGETVEYPELVLQNRKAAAETDKLK